MVIYIFLIFYQMIESWLKHHVTKTGQGFSSKFIFLRVLHFSFVFLFMANNQIPMQITSLVKLKRYDAGLYRRKSKWKFNDYIDANVDH